VSDLGEYGQGDDDFEQSPNPLKGARDYGKRLEKRIRELEKELSDANTKVAKYEKQEKQGNLIKSLASQGLNEKHAKLFLAVNPDVEEITPELVQEFVQEYALVEVSENGHEERSAGTTEGELGFVPAAVPGSASPRPSHKVYKRDEFIKLQETDPAQALLVLQEGRVQLETQL
jgi:hypothetical protein